MRLCLRILSKTSEQNRPFQGQCLNKKGNRRLDSIFALEFVHFLLCPNWKILWHPAGRQANNQTQSHWNLIEYRPCNTLYSHNRSSRPQPIVVVARPGFPVRRYNKCAPCEHRHQSPCRAVHKRSTGSLGTWTWHRACTSGRGWTDCEQTSIRSVLATRGHGHGHSNELP